MLIERIAVMTLSEERVDIGSHYGIAQKIQGIEFPRDDNVRLRHTQKIFTEVN